MKKIAIILATSVFIPGIVYGSIASNFTVNRQSTYAVPRDVSKVLVLDLTLPEALENETLKVESIKIHNVGTATHTDLSKLMIWEDGPSAGWDNDETEVVKILTAPFFDTEISGTFREYSRGDPWQRIFVTLDTTSAGFSALERSIKIELIVNAVVFSDSTSNGPTDESIVGFERIISKDAPVPATPVAPLAGKPEALSPTAIRWHFTDLANNEFGFKLLDGGLNEVAREEQANLSYLDEIGLQPNTEYSGRKVVAFNDRGENFGSGASLFPAVYTLAEEVVEEIEEEAEEIEEVEEVEEEVVEEEVVEEPSLLEKIQTKIAEIQQQINELFNQLNELLQQQVATIWTAFQRFLSSFSGK